MKTKTLAPLMVDACVQFLKDRNIGTKFHPDKNVYVLDTHLMARVVRHNGNLQARVSQDESVLMNIFLKTLLDMGTIESIMTNEKYKITEKFGCNKPTIYVKKTNRLSLRGKKPQFIGNSLAKGEKVNG